MELLKNNEFILAILLVASELLGSLKSVKSNGVLNLFVNLIQEGAKSLKAKKPLCEPCQKIENKCSKCDQPL